MGTPRLYANIDRKNIASGFSTRLNQNRLLHKKDISFQFPTAKLAAKSPATFAAKLFNFLIFHTIGTLRYTVR